MGLQIVSGPSWKDDLLNELNCSGDEGSDLRRNRLYNHESSGKPNKRRNYFPNLDTLMRGPYEE